MKVVLLLVIYSIGLAIPFILSGIYITKFLIFSKKTSLHIVKIQKISGYILLVTGVLIVTGKLQKSDDSIFQVSKLVGCIFFRKFGNNLGTFNKIFFE